MLEQDEKQFVLDEFSHLRDELAYLVNAKTIIPTMLEMDNENLCNLLVLLCRADQAHQTYTYTNFYYGIGEEDRETYESIYLIISAPSFGESPKDYSLLSFNFDSLLKTRKEEFVTKFIKYGGDDQAPLKALYFDDVATTNLFKNTINCRFQDLKNGTAPFYYIDGWKNILNDCLVSRNIFAHNPNSEKMKDIVFLHHHVERYKAIMDCLPNCSELNDFEKHVAFLLSCLRDEASLKRNMFDGHFVSKVSRYPELDLGTISFDEAMNYATEVSFPYDATSMSNFLSGKHLNYEGEYCSDKIVREYKKDAYTIIENSPDSLKDIQISEKRAAMLSTFYKKLKSKQRMYLDAARKSSDYEANIYRKTVVDFLYSSEFQADLIPEIIKGAKDFLAEANGEPWCAYILTLFSFHDYCEYSDLEYFTDMWSKKEKNLRDRLCKTQIDAYVTLYNYVNFIRINEVQKKRQMMLEEKKKQEQLKKENAILEREKEKAEYEAKLKKQKEDEQFKKDLKHLIPILIVIIICIVAYLNS